jgi:phosphoribosyl-AMP cyclohydrolase
MSKRNCSPLDTRFGNGQNYAMNSFLDRVRFNSDGLVPVITQSAISGKVLMLAWMNQDALTQTLESGQAVYFSRSRNEIWIKGLTSGNTQAVKEIRLDCDADAVLLSVEEAGPACHTGDESCFDADLLKRFE